MKKYARISDGTVAEIIEPFVDEEGAEVPIQNRFAPEFVANLIDITGVSPAPDYCWKYDGPLGPDAAPGTFSPPPTTQLYE